MNVENDTQAYIQDLEETVTSLTRLLEVTNVLNSALLNPDARLEQVLGYLMDAAAQITDSEAASVLLWDHNTQQLYFAATTTDNEASRSLIGKPVPIESIAGTILRERRLIESANTEEDPRHYRGTGEEIKFTTRSLLGVPMIAKNNAIGVLEVVNKRSLPWTLADKSNLSMLAAEAAVAIDVANLVNDVQKANQELSELDKLKSDFIAIASHELRTPLGIIMGYASFLQESEDDGTRSYASKVMGSALQLRRIIEDMINLRYLKQKPSDLKREDILLKTVLDDLKRDVMTLTDANNHILEVVCEDDECVINIDRSRLSMSLGNILNNAVSFTPDGGKIRVVGFTPNEREAWIQVIDEGIGLEESVLEKIFEEFYQVEDHMTRRHGGLGIGLSITRALVQVHGGRIWAESAGLNKGSIFTIALPQVK